MRASRSRVTLNRVCSFEKLVFDSEDIDVPNAAGDWRLFSRPWQPEA